MLTAGSVPVCSLARIGRRRVFPARCFSWLPFVWKRTALSGERPLAAALRVVGEESGLNLSKLALEHLGALDCRGDGVLHLFVATLSKSSLDPASCICSSNVVDQHTGRTTSEVDEFAWMVERERARHCREDIRGMLAELLAGGLAERLPLQALATGDARLVDEAGQV